MDACVAMESPCEPYYDKSDNLKRQASQYMRRTTGIGSLLFVIRKHSRAFLRVTFLPNLCFRHMVFYIALSHARCEEAEGVVEPRLNHPPCRTCCGRDSLGAG
jgi:hypothetical protein